MNQEDWNNLQPGQKLKRSMQYGTEPLEIVILKEAKPRRKNEKAFLIRTTTVQEFEAFEPRLYVVAE